MAEMLVILAPGEERLIRVRCAAPPADAAAAEDAAPAPRMNVNPDEQDAPPMNIPPMNARPRRTRKSRKENGATRKNRKQSGGNSYMNFAKVHRKEVLNQHPELKSDVVAVARKIGEAWRKLPEADRKKY